MRHTKKLLVDEYHPLKNCFSLQEEIQDRVNREAEVMYPQEEVVLPENITYPTMETNKRAGFLNFIRQLKA